MSVRKSRFVTIPITIKSAKLFCDAHHSYQSSPVGGLFAIATAEKSDESRQPICVAILGRPSNVYLQSIGAIQVSRLVSIRKIHAASRTLAVAAKAANQLGYSRIISYVSAELPATCYRAAGWNLAAEHKAKNWHRSMFSPNQPNIVHRYEIIFRSHVELPPR